ncbi:hypothetical protein ACSMX9_06615 [Streptomyces sp. LE64]|uniref:hypothetical protein n=1 Tax=Streptomyces sp. LE64 TaxID=3448653 RepID=UPI004040FB3D
MVAEPSLPATARTDPAQAPPRHAQGTVPRPARPLDAPAAPRPSGGARGFARRHRLPLLVTLPALPVYAVWWLFLGTGGGDLAAQEAWTAFSAAHPGTPYNLSWYGGMHVPNYSLLSPYLMTALGVRTVTVLSGIAATWLGALLVERTGFRRPLPPAALLAVALWSNVASGRTTFAFGVAFGIGALLVLTGRHRRLWAAGLLATLSTAASPVSGLFLVVAGGAWFLLRDWGRALALMAPPALVVALTTVLFPFKGEQPMPVHRILEPAVFALVVAVAAPRAWRLVRLSAAIYAVGIVLTYLISSPIGTNVERLALLAAPAVLLAALLVPGQARARRAGLAVALVLSLAWLTPKTVHDLYISTTVPAWAANTDDVIAALDRLGADRTRVEVVPARNHREATAFAPHVNLARGWNRQLDVERGRLFYDGTFSETTYRAWLDRWAVGLVVMHDGRPDGPAEEEAALVRSEPEWLEPVWRDAHWSVYRVRDAVPLAAAPATVLESTATGLRVRMDRAGAATVRVAYSPWLRAEGACLEQDGEYTRLVATEPGTYRIDSSWRSRPAQDCS